MQSYQLAKSRSGHTYEYITYLIYSLAVFHSGAAAVLLYFVSLISIHRFSLLLRISSNHRKV